MKKRIKLFCRTANFNKRWDLLQQLESIVRQTNKAAGFAAFIGYLLVLPFLLATVFKIIWTIGFVGNVEDSFLYPLLVVNQLDSWEVILCLLGGVLVCALPLVWLLYHFAMLFRKKCTKQYLYGEPDKMARDIARKATNISKQRPAYKEALRSVGIFAAGLTVIVAGVINGLDQASTYPEYTWWMIALMALVSAIGLTLPVGFVSFYIFQWICLPIYGILGGAKWSQLNATADSTWVQYDSEEAARRQKAKELEERKAARERAEHRARIEFLSLSSPPPAPEIPTIVDINTGLPMSSDGTGI